MIDPLGQKTLKEYDKAGNLVKLTDPRNAPRPTNTIPLTGSPKSATPAANPRPSNTNTTETATAPR